MQSKCEWRNCSKALALFCTWDYFRHRNPHYFVTVVWNKLHRRWPPSSTFHAFDLPLKQNNRAKSRRGWRKMRFSRSCLKRPPWYHTMLANILCCYNNACFYKIRNWFIPTSKDNLAKLIGWKEENQADGVFLQQDNTYGFFQSPFLKWSSSSAFFHWQACRAEKRKDNASVFNSSM